jgi:predicted enzyme related to lactoylglutathione lyase
MRAMRNAEGTPIWYELLTNDANASTAFYEDVVGWKVQPAAPGAPMHYQMIDAPNAHIGGLMQLTDEMRKKGAHPTWLFYIGVEDVDATVEKVEAAGGALLMPAFDIPNVGRIAMIADPQGNPLYVMRGAMDQASTVFERTGMGKCNWNELATSDPDAGNAFYAKVFGWKYPEKMALPGGGDYVFVEVAGSGVRIGATMKVATGSRPGWGFYFRVPNIGAAIEKVNKGGGKVLRGPMAVPGGDQVIVALDPEGVPFGLAAPGA